MAMGACRDGSETRQVQMVSLDELVPDDDRYRLLEGWISWPAVRSTAAPFYTDFGRPGIDPVVLVKLLLVDAVEGIGSIRGTLRRARTDLSIRRFLGYGLTEQLPSHATLSFAQTRRFVDSSVFEQLFTQVLGQCREQQLLDGRRVLIDATHVEADAALSSLRADLEPVESPDEDGPEGPVPEAPQAPPALSLAEPRSGPTPRRRATNDTVSSTTDPDAALRGKPGQRPHLVHRAQVVVDPKARVIVAVQAERATGGEGDALVGLIGRARWAGHQVVEIGADQGYAGREHYDRLRDLGCVAFVPPQPNMLGHAQGQDARRRCRTPIGRSVAIDRQTHAEGAIGELKNQHALARARWRGTSRLQVQLLLAATAINLKRLTSRRGAADQVIERDQTGQVVALRTTTTPAEDHAAIVACLATIRWCLARLT